MKQRAVRYTFSMKSSSRGFTLIELLVVIAIMGLLTSIVVTSLRDTRNNGIDTAVVKQLGEARTQAELYYHANGNNYSGVCTAGSSAAGISGMYPQVRQAAEIYGGATITTGGADPTQVSCFADATQWMIHVPLKDGTFYCMKHDGTATTSATCTLPPPPGPPVEYPPGCPGSRTCDD